eukprot:3382114-Rhodomonas_salina.1
MAFCAMCSSSPTSPELTSREGALPLLIFRFCSALRNRRSALAARAPCSSSHSRTCGARSSSLPRSMPFQGAVYQHARINAIAPERRYPE